MNPLAACGLPRFFTIDGPAAERLATPEPRGGNSIRLYGRSLAGMQKEALVRTSAGAAWRLASDEGAYLNGLDEAPCPLAFMTAGMAASFMHAIQAGVAAAGVEHRGIRLVQDNYYTMQGSMPRRTMVGGAQPVELEVEIAIHRDPAELRPLILAAVAVAPAGSLLQRALRNTFTLTLNGRVLPLDAIPRAGPEPLPDPRTHFDDVAPVGGPQEALVVRGGMTPLTQEATSHAGSSYAAEQHRTLHLRGICTLRPDGAKLIEQQLYNPHGSIFRLLSDEAPVNGGGGRAPDADTYMSAGIGFCFMTQFGRFARMVGRTLESYRIVQDTRFAAGHVDPVQTHVYLDTPEDAAFAREVVEIGERTCFLHALCRTELETRVEVTTRRAPLIEPA